MLGKLFIAAAFIGVALAALQQSRGALKSSDRPSARSSMQGVRAPGVQSWRQGGSPESAKRTSYRDSGELREIKQLPSVRAPNPEWRPYDMIGSSAFEDEEVHRDSGEPHDDRIADVQ